jgi:hypothetical protein
LLQLFLLQNQSKYGLIWLPKKYKWIILLRYNWGRFPFQFLQNYFYLYKLKAKNPLRKVNLPNQFQKLKQDLPLKKSASIFTKLSN